MTREQASLWLTWARANWHAEGCQCGRCPEARRVLGAQPLVTCVVCLEEAACGRCPSCGWSMCAECLPHCPWCACAGLQCADDSADASPSPACDCRDMTRQRDWDSSMSGCSCEGSCGCHDQVR